ncbi:pyridoxamine 5'-phosphate oxidase family protein [Arabiibacter massiliensis]|uniref:pyridoxamine 5'-phosphate oxidase family protein n=1 Tax=Arabiibacter massiliensis TaxID=1870985 RepID=UPI0009BA0F81|nr:pyridoxamine 5'-phosphate oxidase family protein [Arabiibacter massiliensis]
MEGFFGELAGSEVLVLSTSLDDEVTSRPVSPLVMDGRIVVRTSRSSTKARQMEGNPRVAGCVGASYFTGRARLLGGVDDPAVAAVQSAYAARFEGAFSDEDGFVETDEAFYEIEVATLHRWEYEDGEPVGLSEVLA